MALPEYFEIRNFADVDRWVNEKSIGELEEAIVGANFGDINKQVALAWLSLRRERQNSIDSERALVATEISAKAASQSAGAAIKSVSWAKAAFFVSCLALIISIVKS